VSGNKGALHRFDHYVFKYHATDEEMELMIKGLEKRINL
jgi:hypothetical protein